MSQNYEIKFYAIVNPFFSLVTRKTFTIAADTNAHVMIEYDDTTQTLILNFNKPRIDVV